MDTQGFAAPQSGLTPPGVGRTASARTAARVSKRDGEEVLIGRLNTVGFFGFLPFMFQMVGLIPVVGAPFQRVFMALSETPVSDTPRIVTKFALSIPARVVDTTAWIGKKIRLTDGKGLQTTAGNLHMRADGWYQTLHANVAAPVQRGTHSVVERIAPSRFGKWLERQFGWLTQSRITHHGKVLTKGIDEAVAGVSAAPKAEAGTLWSYIKQMFSSPPAPAYAVTENAKGLLAPFGEQIAAAGKLTGEARTTALATIGKAIETALKTPGLTEVEIAAAQGLQGAVTTLSKTAGALHLHELAAATGGLTTLAGNVVKMVGRVPTIWAMAGAGLVATIAAVGFSANRENRQAHQALKEMKEDVGNDAHPLIKQASIMQRKQSGGRWISAGLSSINQSLFLMPMTGGMALPLVVGGGIGLNKLGALVIPENRALNAYAILKKAERGEIQIEAEQKVEMIRQLVTIVPAVANQGGTENKLSGRIAGKVAARKLNVRDTMRLLANPDQFMALVKEAAADKQKADEAAAAAEKATADKAAAAKAAMPAADKPSMVITAAKGTSQGRVGAVDLQRSAGQV